MEHEAIEAVDMNFDVARAACMLSPFTNTTVLVMITFLATVLIKDRKSAKDHHSDLVP